MLGPYSAIGGYDEQDGQLLWYWFLNESGPGEKYFYEYAGGTYSKHGFLNGNEFFSLYKFLSDILPDWVATTIFKLFGLLLLFSGIYQSSRKIFKLSRLESTYIGIFASTTTYLPYYFALGGYGWNIGLISWIPLIFFAEQRTLNLYAKASILGILATISSEFFILIPLAFYSYFVFFVFLYVLGKISFNYHQILAAILTTIWFFGGHFYQVLELMEVLNYSARFLYSSFDLLPILDLIYQKSLAVYLSLRRPPHYLIPITIGLFLIFKFLNKREIKILIVMMGLVFILPLLMTILFNLLNVPIAKSFRFEQLIYLFVVGVPFFLMYIFTDIIRKRVAIWTLGIISVVGISINAFITIKDMNLRGSYITKSYYADVFESLIDSEEYRVVSNDYLPPPGLPLYYGMNTLDGMKLSSGIRRMYFFQFLNNLEKPHTHRHTVSFENIGENIKLLNIANVKYLVSNLPIQGLTLRKEAKGLQLKDLYKSPLIPKEIKDIRLANDLYLYELSDVWPLIFSSRIKKSSYSFSEREYYQEIIKKDKYISLISIEDVNDFNLHNKEFPASEIKEYSILDEVITIKLTKGGSITINLEFNKRWKASCNGENLQIFPTNAIMMSLVAPNTCKDIELKFL